ncbi:MAG TPA: hypothetical protein VKR32_07355 [Puia sp.]|nr:hypothetical protein [Puia sp.]
MNRQLSKDVPKVYFVRQTYLRGRQPGIRAAFLLRGYTLNEKSLAEKHFSLLRDDSNSFFYDARIPDHLRRLEFAASQPAAFKIFYVGKTTMEWRPPPEYQKKTKYFLQNNFPDWRTTRGKNKIWVGLFEEFGNLWLKFGFENEEHLIPFERIENY